jgi:hypothetical protein
MRPEIAKKPEIERNRGAHRLDSHPNEVREPKFASVASHVTVTSDVP